MNHTQILEYIREPERKEVGWRLPTSLLMFLCGRFKGQEKDRVGLKKETMEESNTCIDCWGRKAAKCPPFLKVPEHIFLSYLLQNWKIWTCEHTNFHPMFLAIWDWTLHVARGTDLIVFFWQRVHTTNMFRLLFMKRVH